jgi:DNA-binding MarR family transcriptional regulator
MAKSDRKRKQLLESVSDEGRLMSTRSVVLHSVVAEKLGLSPSDHKCVDLIYCQGEETLTAGGLAELTGLSTGAVTGVLDRLERAGFIERVGDPKDRRRVIVRRTPDRSPDLKAFFAPMRTAMTSFCERYSDGELELIIGFMRGAGNLMEEQVNSLRRRVVKKSKASAASSARRTGNGSSRAATSRGWVKRGRLRTSSQPPKPT